MINLYHRRHQSAAGMFPDVSFKLICSKKFLIYKAGVANV
jgi:hypothetical protein